jgi:hypothetical protein
MPINLSALGVVEASLDLPTADLLTDHYRLLAVLEAGAFAFGALLLLPLALAVVAWRVVPLPVAPFPLRPFLAAERPSWYSRSSSGDQIADAI